MTNSTQQENRFRVKTHTAGFQLSDALLDLLEAEIARAGIDAQLVERTQDKGSENAIQSADYVTLNFRDKGYSAVSGGYHPVEIMIARNGELQYVTDFAFVGAGDYVELARELDFDFANQHFWQRDRRYALQTGRAMFDLWQANFCSYYRSGVFDVEVTV